ncbi:unnamed protein product, partial [Protopolystoma xenopodis]
VPLHSSNLRAFEYSPFDGTHTASVACPPGRINAYSDSMEREALAYLVLRNIVSDLIIKSSLVAGTNGVSATSRTHATTPSQSTTLNVLSENTAASSTPLVPTETKAQLLSSLCQSSSENAESQIAVTKRIRLDSLIHQNHCLTVSDLAVYCPSIPVLVNAIFEDLDPMMLMSRHLTLRRLQIHHLIILFLIPTRIASHSLGSCVWLN